METLIDLLLTMFLSSETFLWDVSLLPLKASPRLNLWQFSGSMYLKSYDLDSIPSCIMNDSFTIVSSMITKIVNL